MIMKSGLSTDELPLAPRSFQPTKREFLISSVITTGCQLLVDNLLEEFGEYDLKQYACQIPNGSENTLRTTIIDEAAKIGFSFLQGATVGVIYYPPHGFIKPHFDRAGRTLLATIKGSGVYRQYPNTDSVRNRIIMEEMIDSSESDHSISVGANEALLTNASYPHEFVAGESGRLALYIAETPQSPLD